MTETTQIDLTDYIRDIPDFPQPGILFRDITPLLLAPEAFREAIRQMAEHYRDRRIDVLSVDTLSHGPSCRLPGRSSQSDLAAFFRFVQFRNCCLR